MRPAARGPECRLYSPPLPNTLARLCALYLAQVTAPCGWQRADKFYFASLCPLTKRSAIITARGAAHIGNAVYLRNGIKHRLTSAYPPNDVRHLVLKEFGRLERRRRYAALHAQRLFFAANFDEKQCNCDNKSYRNCIRRAALTRGWK